MQVGEIGDATDAVIRWLDGHDGRPPSQLRFETGDARCR